MAEYDSPYCVIRRQLVEEFALTARLYAEAVVPFTGPAVTPTVRDHQEVCAAVRQALERSESAAPAYDEYAAAHGCEVLIDPLRGDVAVGNRRWT